jgi:hypothetical protein
VTLPVDPTAPHGAPAIGDVSVTRTPGGWAVVSPAGSETAGELVEGLTLADLVAEESGVCVDPDRSARRSARGPAPGADDDTGDPRDARIAALERTVAQLEHALAARVAIERAIGVLAERDQVAPRAAFDGMRGSARSQGRAVAELAREVLASLPLPEEPARPTAPGPRTTSAPVPRSAVGTARPHRDAEDTRAGGCR